MITFSGKSVYRGIAVGPVVVLKKEDPVVRRTRVDDPNREIERVRQAAELSRHQLQTLYEKAVLEVGEAGAAIFEAHQIMLEDEDYLAAITNMIRSQSVSAEYAVAVTGDNFSGMFASMEDDYMKARSADVKDVSNRLIQNITGDSTADFDLTEPSILVADELSPSETVQLDKKNILAFVTIHGSLHSHMSILARVMNIPALIGVPFRLEEIQTGMKAVVDGFRGEITFDPDEDTCKAALQRIEQEQRKRCLLKELKGKEAVTKSGRRVHICANISGIGDVGYVLENDADGIGLFRSEFLYLKRNDFPTEEEQLRVYRQVLETMGEKKVVIRTLDIGADKQADYFSLPKEANPALGYRAIRICLTCPDLFKIQLRALLRAAMYGNLSILYPMITSTEEVAKIYALVQEAASELEREQVPFRIPKQGIMIETPAAVMISDELADMVDFFSIGTNDLTQYTLAIDRQNGRLDAFYNPHHPAILRMIRLTVENAHRHKKPVGICGELGADLTLTEKFVNLGIDELSVAPAMVLPLRKRIREIS